MFYHGVVGGLGLTMVKVSAGGFKRGMMDYYGFWQGFIILFGVLPVVVGAIIGVLWAWWNGQRGTKLRFLDV